METSPESMMTITSASLTNPGECSSLQITSRLHSVTRCTSITTSWHRPLASLVTLATRTPKWSNSISTSSTKCLTKKSTITDKKSHWTLKRRCMVTILTSFQDTTSSMDLKAQRSSNHISTPCYNGKLKSMMALQTLVSKAQKKSRSWRRAWLHLFKLQTRLKTCNWICKLVLIVSDNNTSKWWKLLISMHLSRRISTFTMICKNFKSWWSKQVI